MKKTKLFFMTLLAGLLMSGNVWGEVVAGHYYTILADFYNGTNDNNRYLVESNGNLGFQNYNTTVSTNYYWKAVADGSKFKFQSATQPTKYLTPETGGLSTTAKSYTISTEGSFYHLYAYVNNKGDRYIGTWGPSRTQGTGFGNSNSSNTGCFGGSQSHTTTWTTYYTLVEIPSVDVTYVYKYNGTEVARESTKALPGAAYPTPTLATPYQFTYTAPTGTVPSTESTVDITVTASGEFPFEFGTSVDDAKWYTWKMANRVNTPASYKGYVAYDTSAGMFLETDYDEQPTDASHLYAFIGNPFSFEILTANGQYVYTSGANNSVLTRADEGSAFTARASSLSSGWTDYSHYFYMSLPTDNTGSVNEMANSTNKRKIGYWTGGGKGDNGSLVAVEAVDLKVYMVNMIDVPAGTDITFTNAEDVQTVNNDSEYKTFLTTVDINEGNLATYVSAPEVTDFSKSVTISGRTITVKYTTESAEVAKETFLRPVIATVKTALDANKGYPGQRVTTDLKSAYDTAVAAEASATIKASEVKDAAKTLQTALDDYNASTTIYQPVDGKVYHLNLHFSTGSEYYMYANGSALTTNTTANNESTDYPKTAAFVAYQTAEGGYTFKSGSGYYLNLNDAGSGKSVGTMTTAYNANTSRILVKCLGANTQGYVTLANTQDLAFLKNAKEQDKDQARVLIIKQATFAFDGTGAPYYNGTFTSAVSFTAADEMAYKLVFASSCPSDAAIVYNPGTGDVTWTADEHNPYVITESVVTTDQLTAQVRTGYTPHITINEETKTITMTCDVEMTTYTVNTVPTGIGGVTLVEGGTTLTNGQTFQFAGEPKLTTDFTAVAVEGYNSTSFIGNGKVTIVYNRPAQVLWTTVGASSGELYRIPSIGVTKTGKLIAVTDKRWGGDIGNNNRTSLAYRTSTDNGVTWTDARIMAESSATTGTKDRCFSDPSIIADRDNANKLVGFSCNGPKGYGEGNWISDKNTYCATARYNSEDGGETWTTTYLEDYFYTILGDVKSLFVTSGRILQSRYYKKGDYYRIFMVLCARNASGSDHNRVMYSDDFGTTWQALGGVNAQPCPGGNEAKVEELPDGRIFLSSRKGSGRYFNVFTYTNTEKGEGYWQGRVDAPLSNIEGLTASSNGCNGEVLIVPVVRKADNTPCYILLQSVPTGSKRENVTIFFKELLDAADIQDVNAFATNWDGAYQVSNTTSAYSTMVLQNDNNIGFFWEDNLHNDGYDETYISLPMELITHNQYSVTDEAHRLNFIQSTLPGVIDATVKEGSYVGQVKAEDKQVSKNAIAAWTVVPTAAQLDAVFNIPSIALVEGGLYRFVNAYPDFEAQQGFKKAIYSDGANGLKWQNYDNTAVNQVFKVSAKEGNVLTLFGINDGFYPQAQTTNDTAIPMSSTLNTVTMGTLATDQFSLTSKGSGNMFHCGGHSSGAGVSGSVVIWGGAANSCSAWYIEPVTSIAFNETISAAGYATYSAAVDVEVPEGVTAYYASNYADGKVTMTEVEDKIPANTGVILQAAAGEYAFNVTTEATAITDNLLLPAVAPQSIVTPENNTDYIFAKKDEKIGFFKLNSSDRTIAGHKCWLRLNNGGSVKDFVEFDLNDPTGIADVDDNVDVNDIYNLAGQRVNKLQKGINIVNGKKVLY